jgi:transcriptional regulator with XRE-family HTH domain
MSSISFSLLDEQMTNDDKEFFQVLGQRMAGYRKEINMTQVQLAKMLDVSQQVIAAYEAGRRKLPASLLPVLAKLFAVPLDELIGIKENNTKRGPASILQRQIEQVALLPRTKQKFVMEMLDTVLKQQQSAI